MQLVDNLLSHGRVAVRSMMDGDDSGLSSTTITSMIVLLSLVFVGLLLASTLVMLRRKKLLQQMEAMNTLPQYNKSVPAGHSKGHGLTIQTTAANGRSSLVVFSRDGHPMLANPHSPPHSPDNVPEIRITFPDEQDESGQRKSGRVVVVRVGDATIGMEPLPEQEEQLPAYEKESKGQFYSIDIDQIGGLKEKEKSDHANYH